MAPPFPGSDIVRSDDYHQLEEHIAEMLDWAYVAELAIRDQHARGGLSDIALRRAANTCSSLRTLWRTIRNDEPPDRFGNVKIPKKKKRKKKKRKRS